MPCPEVLSLYERLSIISQIIDQYPNETPNRCYNLSELRAATRIIYKVMGEDYVSRILENIQKGDDLSTIEQLYSSGLAEDQLRINHFAGILQNVYCMKGFQEKVKVLRTGDFYPIQYEIEIAAIFCRQEIEIEFILPVEKEKTPDFEMKTDEFAIGCECKFKNIRRWDDHKVVRGVLTSAKRAAQQLDKYPASYIFIGGFIPKEKLPQVQTDIERKLTKFLQERPTINGIAFTPIRFDTLSKINVVRFSMDDIWIKNPNENIELPAGYPSMETSRVHYTSPPLLGENQVFPHPRHSVDYFE
jgi:hypothetical protein